MKTLTQHLTKYASYHRDRRNITTHFIGIPMIVFAVIILLARLTFDFAGLPISLATLVVIAASFYYIKLDIKFGYSMAILLLIGLWFGQFIAEQSVEIWICTGLGLFLVGWLIQFIGHYFEGLKPAFVDDVMGLMIGPLFVVAELAFLLGWRLEVRNAIESHFKH